ncbi:MAG TPA: phosphatase PAP2 family protein [Thermoanaerobaculia bacterium]|jgi:undecaprenyl-diphosphatase
MTRQRVVRWGAALALLSLIAIFALDAPVARAAAALPESLRAAALSFTGVVEIVFGFPVSKWLTGAVIVAAALLLALVRRYRPAAQVLLFIGCTQLAARLIAGVLKNVFARPRPFQMLGGVHTGFFSDGSSFPSGHVAHFWPFFFAVALVYPRWRWPFFALALLLSIVRVAVNDHYVSDVVASAAISAFVAAGCARLLRVGVRPTPATAPDSLP